MGKTVWVKAISTEGVAPLAGLEGRWRRWVQPSAENGGMVFGVGELQPGEVAGWHEHPEAEVFYVLTGHGEARWREGSVVHRAELRPGVAFFKVGGVPHQMANLGDVPLVGLAFKTGGA